MKTYIVQDQQGRETFPFTTMHGALNVAAIRSYERSEPMYICENHHVIGRKPTVHRIVDVRPLQHTDTAPLHCELPNGK